MHALRQPARGGELQVHVVLAGGQRGFGRVTLSHFHPHLDGEAQRLRAAGLFRIDAGQYVDVQVVDLQRQIIVKNAVHSSPCPVARRARVQFDLSFCGMDAIGPPLPARSMRH